MKQTPVLIITGFLGSGKTTFINWLVHEFHIENWGDNTPQTAYYWASGFSKQQSLYA